MKFFFVIKSIFNHTSDSTDQGWAGKDIFEFPFPVFAFAGNTCCLSLPTRQQILLPATKNVAGEFEIVLPEISGNLPFVAGKHIAGNHSSFCRNLPEIRFSSEGVGNIQTTMRPKTTKNPQELRNSGQFSRFIPSPCTYLNNVGNIRTDFS